MRRRLHIVLLASLLAFANGCMVLDEVDAANAKMVKKKPAAKTATPAPTATSNTTGVLEETKQWWKRASSLSPAEKDSSIVQCRIDGGTQFMSRDDCLSRGGSPKGGAG